MKRRTTAFLWALSIIIASPMYAQIKTGQVNILETTGCSTGVAGVAVFCADSTSHLPKMNPNNTGFVFFSTASQSITWAGLTAARTMTLPDANATIARTDTGQTFAGNNTFSGQSLASGSIARVSGSDFTTAANTNLQTITGLTFTLPANTAANYPLRCELLYSQATAAVADQFGIQAATFNPTNIMAGANVMTSATAQTAGNLPTLATTTATAIVTFTPSAITTIWNAHLFAMVENPSNASTQTVNVMVQTSTAADVISVKRGSYCVMGF